MWSTSTTVLFATWWSSHTKVSLPSWMKLVLMLELSLTKCSWKQWTTSWKVTNIIPVEGWVRWRVILSPCLYFWLLLLSPSCIDYKFWFQLFRNTLFFNVNFEVVVSLFEYTINICIIPIFKPILQKVSILTHI